MLFSLWWLKRQAWNCCQNSLPLNKLLTRRYPTLRRRTDSLSSRERTSSGKGRRSISLSSSPFSRSRWRFDGFDLTTSLLSEIFFLVWSRQKTHVCYCVTDWGGEVTPLQNKIWVWFNFSLWNYCWKQEVVNLDWATLHRKCAAFV